MKELYGTDSESESDETDMKQSALVKKPLSKTVLQIRYKSGSEVLFDSEQKREFIEYLELVYMPGIKFWY